MERLKRTVILAFANELIDQGHRDTSALIQSLDAREVKTGEFDWELEIWGLKYAFYLDKGVRKDRIPYTKGRGRGGRSKYIQALIAYFKRKGAADPKAAAFATANAHKKQGMPTKASLRFSSTGTRLGFMDAAMVKNDEIISRRITRVTGKRVDKKVDNIMNKLETQGGGSGVWIF